jgi:hypothetical protein
LAGNAAVARAVEEERHVHDASCGHPPPVQRSVVDGVLASTGRPLDASVRQEMEARLSADFSDVRLHTDQAARQSAAELGARAYTSGSHVVIGQGDADKHTLAHELTHVIQQRSGPVAGIDNGAGLSVSDPSDRFERAAEANAQAVMRGPVPDRATPAPASGGPGATGVAQRMMSTTAAGPGTAAPVPAAPVPAAPVPAAPVPTPGLDGSLGKEIPAYWANLAWIEENPGVWSAVIDDPNHPVFRAVQQYAHDSQDMAPYTSAAGEKTRMDAVRTDLAELRTAPIGPLPQTSLPRSAIPTLENRLNEGRRGGPRPPASHIMQITHLRVVANRELWKKYSASKELFQQSLLIKHDEQGFTPGGDPSDEIKWSTGSRPDLGGAAATTRVPGYHTPSNVNPMPPSDAGEAWLFHGTKENVAKQIQEGGGFDPSRSANKGTPAKPRYGPLGQGVYLADNTSKAQTYGRCPECGDYDCTDPTHPPRTMLLNRALVGHPNMAHIYDKSRRGDDYETLKEGRTSVVSQSFMKFPTKRGATGTNEFVIKDQALLYPEITVYYR